MSKALLGVAMVFIVVAVSLMIGGAIFEKTYNTTEMFGGHWKNASNHSQGWVTTALLSGLYADSGNSLTTFTSLLPIVALAVVGGIAIAYLMGFLGGKTE